MMQTINIFNIDHNVQNSTDLYGKFKISPLKKGEGITIGNSLRRTLLSKLKGVEIQAIKIILNDRDFSKIHEFSIIPGIKESVLEILLNIKNIVIAYETEFLDIEKSFTNQQTEKKNPYPNETFGKINVKGPKRITAKDIKLPNKLKIINPNQYITTLNNNENLEILFFLKQNQTNSNNFSKNEIKDSIEKESDKIEIDYNFTPIKKVNYMLY